MNQKRILCDKLPFSSSPAPLSESEAHHATGVLRLRDGDAVTAIDGRGSAISARFYVKGGTARLEAAPGAQVERARPGDVVPLVLEMAVLKGDAMEWVIEKAVELGARAVVPVLTERVVVQMDRKGPEAFCERWNRVAMQSLKQCERLERLEIRAPVALSELVRAGAGEARIFGDERGGAPALAAVSAEVSSGAAAREIHLMIGPEGGFSPEERELLLRARARPASLGPFILRAETAAIAGVSILVSGLRQSIISA